MNTRKKSVYVAMSGGVDSSVAAYLLQQQGYRVTGVYMKNWSDPLSNHCPWRDDIKDFKKVCQILKIKSKIEVFEDVYRKKIVNYLIDGYKKGITPNPDVLCNREIKFKVFLDKALKMGADFIATGHYINKRHNSGGFYELLKAKDENKDQSYFLALLNQRQLKKSIFPIGEYIKNDVRKIAKKIKLPVYNKKDSQGICFIGDVKFNSFLKQFIGIKPGQIQSTDGKALGNHEGLPFYTIGQRRGMGIGGGIPYYVVKKDIKNNLLIVARGNKDQSLYNNKLKLKNFHWIHGSYNQLPKKCLCRIRYRQPLQSCLIRQGGKSLEIIFNKNQRAIAPGQFAVLYSGNLVLGGGVIFG